MLNIKLFLIGLVFITISCDCNNSIDSNDITEREIDFSLNWDFYKLTDKETPNTSNLSLEGISWSKVNLPHDWSIEGKFIAPPKELDKENLTVAQLGGHLGKRSTGYLEGGTGWYQKVFTMPKDWENKNIHIDFDGVYMYSDVWINGTHLGHHHYGYTAFGYDLTPYLKNEGENHLLVKVRNNLESRWYAGSGIYRPVKIRITNDQYVDKWGTYVVTPEITKERASVVIETNIINASNKVSKVYLNSIILNCKDQVVAEIKDYKKIDKQSKQLFKQTTEIISPQLWNLENPELYRVISEVVVNDKVMDRYHTNFGVREIKFDKEKGFLLNGIHTPLKGVCIHHDNGILGAKSFAWAEERKVIKLKEMGTNAIRFSHNPPSKEMLDICDRHGMLAIDEAFDEWRVGKAKGYEKQFDTLWKKDMSSMVLRDRNHPSVIMWSIGNEIPEQGMARYGAETASMLANFVKELDPTRPTTHAVQPGGGRWGNHFPFADYFDAVDIAGYNYENWSKDGKGEFVMNHEKFPNRIMYQSESAGKFLFDIWMKVTDNPYILGDFIWTGIDYLGEVGCGAELKDQKKFPAYIASCGDFEHTMFPKPRYYYHQVLWLKRPVVHINVQKKAPYKITSWGWQPAINSWNLDRKEGEICNVDVYSNCDEVELFFNRKSLGRKRTSRNEKFIAQWKVPFHKGELKAVAYREGKAVSEDIIKSAKSATTIKLTSDRKTIEASGMDICYVTVELCDEKGIRNSLTQAEVEFEIEGPGEIIAVGNGSHYAPLNYPFIGKKGISHEGRLLVVIRSFIKEGEIKLTAKANGLEKGIVSIIAN